MVVAYFVLTDNRECLHRKSTGKREPSDMFVFLLLYRLTISITIEKLTEHTEHSLNITNRLLCSNVCYKGCREHSLQYLYFFF